MRKTDNLGGITAFVTTAQQGSFTAAAEQLGLTKSAVGKSVSRLEARLGLTLFQRSTRRLSLTPDGEAFLSRCQQAIDILEQAEAELTSHVIHPSGRLRVDLPSAFGRQRVLPILLAITQRYPELSLTVTFSERFVDLIEEGIDLVVRIGELADSSGLVARRLTTQKLVICAAPAYLAAFGEPLSTEALAHHRCVVGFRRNQPISWLLKSADGRVTRFTPPPTFEMADGDAMLAATLSGCGLSQLPRWPKNRQLLPKIRYAVDELVRAGQEGRLD
ncbi:LysR substrate-binding domain-containing protein [Kluyvera sichuanensis]|uniref:LysR substrate-binding domain-containing protein n=1 Tax=Kluyvera sichuanensis TaxID=2725494 RepID=UPI0039F638B4